MAFADLLPGGPKRLSLRGVCHKLRSGNYRFQPSSSLQSKIAVGIDVSSWSSSVSFDRHQDCLCFRRW